MLDQILLSCNPFRLPHPRRQDAAIWFLSYYLDNERLQEWFIQKNL